ncbi:MAG: Acetyl-CoA:oxalate CoA-transferase [Deltaproteobacteria bacterium]|jgi:crotonobetainyl-CoA:carnitine CoA-transferase CaiB-like acyl-CoA transferase|nr:Acetyl-CoA:oxalate CoA-transferase [Deltaproteobacteria bacterium]
MNNSGPLHGLRILDLSRILAGPTCTQMLGDLGADVIKVERPGAGDDTRKWGPPYLKGTDRNDTTESAYYLSANRNKRSLTVNISLPEGQNLIRKLAAKSDVLVENYKVGGMKKYGLDYENLKSDFPDLIYCSITGFGQTGPKSHRPGYDFMIQAMGGIMSVTGEPDGSPMKVGVGIADVMCGMYAAISILAAIRHREQGGKGQHIDLALLDSQAAWLINSGLNYLTSRQDQHRMGNAHPNVVPYQVYQTSDSFFVLAIGNDTQFRKFCEFAEAPEMADDLRFKTNADRVRNRDVLAELINDLTKRNTKKYWLQELEKLQVPCGPVNTIKEVFDDPQIQHREMEITMPHHISGNGQVSLIGSPIKMTETPVSYRNAPPTLGQHTDVILEELLGISETERIDLAEKGVI